MSQEQIDQAMAREYAAGFTSDIESDTLPPGLDEDVVRFISGKKNEPRWMLEWRLEAYRNWRGMTEPEWAHVKFPPVDFNAISYYSAPRSAEDRPGSLDEVDPELLEVYEKLGIPLHEQAALAGVAVDAVFDSVSVATTFREKLAEAGVIFCSISEALREHPELVKKHIGSVVPRKDNFYAALNSAVFSDGSFVYIPKGVRCPMELSTYFRINEANTGQFERTLIVADEGSHVSYLEGCTAPMRDENQLHAAVVELVALDGAEIKYSTVQNWYPGDADGKGGIYNFVTKRAVAHRKAKVSWTQVVRMSPKADGARNYTQCDSLLIGDRCAAHTFPYIESRNPGAVVEHEATTSRVGDDQLYLCRQRGMDPEKAVSMIVNGFCREVFRELPMEFAVEAGKLLEVSLEGSVG